LALPAFLALPVTAWSAAPQAAQMTVETPIDPSILVLTTVPERAQAEALARELVSSRLAACIQIGSTVQSLYHWQGQIETAAEIPMAIKTRVALYPQVEEAIRKRHPYELPEIVAVPITGGLPGYLAWIAAETKE
jgi:periplasmic divalent cation tolerance protein